MNRTFAYFTVLALCAMLGVAPAKAQPMPNPKAQPAIDGVFAAFANHPLVGISDHHSLAQEADFYIALVRDPRFAREVGNVVVEFGDAAHQDIIDRYVTGGEVPYTELRKVWTDAVGAMPTYTGQGYADFYLAVRQANAKLPPDQRIRVWLGEPPIDFSKIHSREDYGPYVERRDEHAAQVIIDNILTKNRKALVIYGGGHLSVLSPADRRLQKVIEAAGGPRIIKPWLRDLVEKARPGAMYVIELYDGFDSRSCSALFEENASAWPVPALVSALRGSPIEAALRSAGCGSAADFRIELPGLSKAAQDEFDAAAQAKREELRLDLGFNADALLYLGPAATLTYQPTLPDLAFDADYRREIERRSQFTGPLPPLRAGQSSPRPFRVYREN